MPVSVSGFPAPMRCVALGMPPCCPGSLGLRVRIPSDGLAGSPYPVLRDDILIQPCLRSRLIQTCSSQCAHSLIVQLRMKTGERKVLRPGQQIFKSDE
jgi:hypothetical protein